MNRLDKHIEILLLSNDCVIVPELGGFMAHYVPARYDEDDMFIPPTRTLGFNPQLVMNDSLLAQAYVEAYDISFPEAIRRIEDDVNELRQILEQDEEFNLSSIGRLFYNIEGKLEFEPCSAGILTPWLYGLNSFMFKTLSEVESQPRLIQTVVKEETQVVQKESPVSPIENDKQPELEMEDSIEDVEEEEHKAICIPLNAVRYSVAVACMIIAIMLFPSTLSDNLTEESSICNQEMKIETMPKAVPIKNKKEVVKPETLDSKEVVSDKTSITETAPKKEENDKEIAKPYHTIILASKVSKVNAEAFVKTLGKKGVKADILIRNSITRVVCGKYNTEADAYNALRQIRDTLPDAEEAWVMEIKN